jgi:hypothetical protein
VLSRATAQCTAVVHPAIAAGLKARTPDFRQLHYDSAVSGSPGRAEVFPVGPPVALEHQVGRLGDIERVGEALRGGDHVVLSDDRRTGKSTVALGALDLLSADEPAPVIVAINLSEGIGSSSELAAEIVHQVAIQRSDRAVVFAKARRLASGLWNRAKDITIPADADPEEAIVLTGLLKALESKQSGIQRLAAALDEVERLAAERVVDATVLVDEAPELAGWDDAEDLQRELRKRMRATDRRIAFVYAGSDRSMMKSLFAPDGLLAFDGQHLELSPLHDDLAREDLRRSFRDLGSDIAGRGLDVMITAADGRPLRLMLVANKAHRLASEVGEAVIDEDIAMLAVREARQDRLWTAVS